MKTRITDFTHSSTRSAQILKPELLEKIFLAYFGHTYLGYEMVDDREEQRSGIDIWIHTKEGAIGVDLKACTQSVADHLHLEIYSVREERKLGYLLKREAQSRYVLFVSADGLWRLFNHARLAAAMRSNFKHWAGRFGVKIQSTRCSWRKERSYTSSAIRVPTSWVRAAYYSNAAAA